jgi:hypothetical protein
VLSLPLLPWYCRATINRYGFNSAGAEAAAAHLESFCAQAERHPDIKPGKAVGPAAPVQANIQQYAQLHCVWVCLFALCVASPWESASLVNPNQGLWGSLNRHSEVEQWVAVAPLSAGDIKPGGLWNSLNTPCGVQQCVAAAPLSANDVGRLQLLSCAFVWPCGCMDFAAASPWCLLLSTVQGQEANVVPTTLRNSCRLHTWCMDSLSTDRVSCIVFV